MNGKDQYSGLDLRTRKMLLGSFRVFFRHMPVKYHTFAYATKQFASLDELAGTMRRDLVNFLFDNLAELQSYDMAKVYYDNGQHSIAESLHRAVEYALSKDAVVYRSAQPSEYRLSQAADYICTMELTAITEARKGNGPKGRNPRTREASPMGVLLRRRLALPAVRYPGQTQLRPLRHVRQLDPAGRAERCVTGRLGAAIGAESRAHPRTQAFQSNSTRTAPLEVTRCASDNRSCYNASTRDENTAPVG